MGLTQLGVEVSQICKLRLQDITRDVFSFKGCAQGLLRSDDCLTQANSLYIHRFKNVLDARLLFGCEL
jgi:hypothetical protein